MSQGRNPAELRRMIELHKQQFGDEPRLIMVRDSYRELHKFFFRGSLHILCCGKGAIFDGIPAIITSSAMVDTFLICY